MTTTVVESYPNGDKYEGQVSGDGVKSGWGKYTFANGKIYEGHWAVGKMNGWGEFTESDTNDRFVGEWEDANRKFGIYFYANGDMYQGGFERSMKHGKGVIWENKVMYEASYNRDKLLSKVPWKVRMNENSNAPIASTSPVRQSPQRGGGAAAERELAQAQARILELQERNDSQGTQLLIMTKEIQALQQENHLLQQHPSGKSPPHERQPRSSIRRTATPTRASSKAAGGPPPFRSGPSTPRARSTGRSKGGTFGTPTSTKSGLKSAIYKKKSPDGTFDTMGSSRLREEFRYYYNQ